MDPTREASQNIKTTSVSNQVHVYDWDACASRCRQRKDRCLLDPRSKAWCSASARSPDLVKLHSDNHRTIHPRPPDKSTLGVIVAPSLRQCRNQSVASSRKASSLATDEPQSHRLGRPTRPAAVAARRGVAVVDCSPKALASASFGLVYLRDGTSFVWFCLRRSQRAHCARWLLGGFLGLLAVA